MDTDDIHVEAADALSAEISELVSALDSDLNARCGPERNHGSPVARLSLPDVIVFLARRRGEPIGCAALQLEAGGWAEVKRMYVAPAHRGAGVGRLLLARVEREAIQAGVGLLRLETSEPLREAIALYRRSGFTPCAAFGPYVAEPINIYFEKALARP